MTVRTEGDVGDVTQAVTLTRIDKARLDELVKPLGHTAEAASRPSPSTCAPGHYSGRHVPSAVAGNGVRCSRERGSESAQAA